VRISWLKSKVILLYKKKNTASAGATTSATGPKAIGTAPKLTCRRC
jgi:hypothetical protein